MRLGGGFRTGFPLRRGLIPVGTGRGLGQVAQGSGIGRHHRRALDLVNLARRGANTSDRHFGIWHVENLDTGAVGDGHLADHAVGFLHQGDAQILAVFVVQPDLGAADADGRGLGMNDHGIGIQFGNDAADHGEDATGQRQCDRSFLRCRVVDRLVQNGFTALAHGKHGFVDKHHADGGTFAGGDGIALKDGITYIQLHAGAVGAHHHNGPGRGLDAPDRLITGFSGLNSFV